MKKRLFGLLLALCMVISLLPVVVLADAAKPTANYLFITQGDAHPEEEKDALKMNAGDAPLYYATKQTDPNFPNNWYMTPGSENDWNVKLEYPANGIPTITLKNAHMSNRCGFWLGGWDFLSEHDVKVIVEGENFLSDGAYCGSLNFRIGNHTVTITGGGKITVNSNGNSHSWGVIGSTGNIIMDDVDLDITFSEDWGCTGGISTTGGDLTIKNCNIKMVGYDDPNTTHDEGTEGGFGRTKSAMDAGLLAFKSASGTGGNLRIENSNVSIAGSPTERALNDDETFKSLIYAANSFTIKDSTVELGLVGYVEQQITLFNGSKPTLEFANNSYTTAVTKTKLPTLANGVMTPAADKYIDYAATTGISSITYFKVYPGGDGSSFGVIEETFEEEPDINTDTGTDMDTDTDIDTNTESTDNTEADVITEATVNTEATVGTEADANTDTNDEAGSKNGTWIVILIVVLVVLAGGGAAVYFFIYKKRT